MAELARRHQRLANLRGVREAIRGVGRFRDGLLELVQTARLERHADGLAVLPIGEATIEHALHDGNQAIVDLALSLGLRALLDVLVDGFCCSTRCEGGRVTGV